MRITVKASALITVAIVLMLLGFLAPAAAQLRVSPVMQMLETRRGAVTVFNLQIVNEGQETVKCTMEAGDMALSPRGIPGPAHNGTRGCGAWITVQPDKFTLEGGSSQKVVGRLRTPRGADFGGHYASVSCLAQPAARERHTTGVEITLSTQLYTVLLVTVRGGRLETRIEATTVRVLAAGDLAAEGQAGGTGWAADVVVKNTGNMHLQVTGELSLLSEAGQRIARMPLEAGLGWVLAEGERVFSASGDQPLPDGVYLLQARFHAGRRTLGAAAQTFTVLQGKAEPGEPTEALRAAIEASRPLFMLQPDSLYFELPPRGRRSQALQVMNLTEESLQLEPRLLAWTRDEQGNVIFPDQPNHGRFLPDALTVKPATITVRPRSRQNLTLTFAMPAEAAGEYYVALALAPPGQELPDDPYLLAQRAALVTAQALQTVQREAVISGLDVKKLEGGGYEFEVTIENTGNCRCRAEGQIEIIHGAETMERLLFGSAETFLLPAGQRQFTINWPRVLEPGGYRAIATVRYAEGEQAQEEVTFQVEEGATVSGGETTEQATTE